MPHRPESSPRTHLHYPTPPYTIIYQPTDSTLYSRGKPGGGNANGTVKMASSTPTPPPHPPPPPPPPNGPPPPDSPSVSGAVDEDSVTAAVRAAQYNSLPELQELLDVGKITPNTRDGEDCTLLQWAAINNRKNIVAELLERGADANAAGGFLKETALQWAVRQGALEAIVVLVEQGGADPHIAGTEGLNALHLAIQGRKPDVLLYLCATHPSLCHAPTSAAASLPHAPPVMYLVAQWAKGQRAGSPGVHHHERVADRKRWQNMLRSLLAFGADVFAQQKATGDSALHLGVGMK
jgi:hypothetical protein